MSEVKNQNAPKPPMGGRGGGHMGGGGPAGAASRPTEKAKDFSRTLKRLVRYLSPEKIKFIVVALLAVMSTVFSIFGPKVMGQATNILSDGVKARIEYSNQITDAQNNNLPQSEIEALAEQGAPKFDFKSIGQILLIMLVLYVISALCSFAMSFLMSDVSQKTVYRLRNDVKLKLDKLPLKYFDTRTHGEILSRVTNDMDNIATTLQQSLTQLITSVITIIGVLILMLTISPTLTLIALVTLPVSAILTMNIAKRSQKYFAGQQRALGNLNGHVEEMYSGHKIIKAFGREKSSIEAFEKINADLCGHAWKAQFVSGMIMPALNFISNIGYVLVCVVGGVLVVQKKIKVGDVQAFISYMKQLTNPIVQTANIMNTIQSTIASAERVFEVLDEQEEVPEIANPVILQSSNGNVRFEHVKFGYSKDSILINDMNLEAKPGQTIAIVGPTGAGKTTVVNLLLRFYEISGGTITVDGTNITDMPRADLRRLFGMVLQDTWLFGGTIEENLAYSKDGVTHEEIVAAAKTAHADRFIRSLPDGYNTILNEEASNISQGQKQLLTIARAILFDPPILILDEATSSVDTRTEQRIQRAMHNLMKGRTSFVIAHRLSTIKNADSILVMKRGSIIEQGTHEELLAADGFYADLYNSQFAAIVS